MPQTVDLGTCFINPLQVVKFEERRKQVSVADGLNKSVEEVKYVHLDMANGTVIEVEGADIAAVAKAIDIGLSTNPIWCDTCGKEVKRNEDRRWQQSVGGPGQGQHDPAQGT